MEKIKAVPSQRLSPMPIHKFYPPHVCLLMWLEGCVRRCMLVLRKVRLTLTRD
jgi:hypothetical protein